MKYRIFDDFEENSVDEQLDGSRIVTVKWEEDNWVHGFVLSYGEYIEVLEPEHLRKAIMDKAEKILSKYM